MKMGLLEYISNELLFIDSSKWILKCVRLHNGNKYGSRPISSELPVQIVSSDDGP